MNLLKSCKILNYDKSASTIAETEFVERNILNNKSYIVSECDEELLILLEFKQATNLHNIVLYAFPFTTDESKHDDDQEDIDASPPKLVHIYKSKHLNVDFNDIASFKPDKTVTCASKKLAKGLVIKLQKESKNAIKFKNVQHLIIYITSNQNDTEQTYLNAIVFNGEKPKTHRKTNDKTNNLMIDTKDSENVKQSLEYFSTIKETDFQQDIGFKQRLDQKVSVNSNCIVSTCESTRNICSILHQYQRFIALSTDEGKNDNNSELYEVYPNDYSDTQLINDFNHLLFNHQHNLDNLDKIFFDDECICDVSKCYVTKRNHRDRAVDDHDEMTNLYFTDDKVLISLQQILDKIHTLVYHSVDFGLQYSSSELATIKEECKEMKAEMNLSTQAITITLQKGTTYKHNNSKYITMSRNKSLYSFGYRFYYWSYFKDNDAICDRSLGLDGEMKEANPGYSLGDLYVAAKYNSFKEELTHNSLCYISLFAWEQTLCKATKHYQSELTNTYVCKWNYQSCTSVDVMYPMHDGDPIELHHIIAIMFYCNYDKLQRNFSNTFRYKHEKENIVLLKRRHSNYAIWAKYLREAFFYGQTTDHQIQNPSGNYILHSQHELYRLPMTFYHGIDSELNFGSVHCHINGPLSTTTSYLVAVNFSQAKGVIAEMECGKYYPYTDSVPYFDCCWLSDFPVEQEKFFIGGTNPMIFVDICHVLKTGVKWYSQYVRALLHLESIIAFSSDIEYSPDTTTKKMSYCLLSHALHKYYQDDMRYHAFTSIPPYVDQLLHNTCVSIMRAFPSTSNTIFKHLFCYDNNWIKLDRFLMVFPSIVSIKISEIALNASIFLSVLSYLSSNWRTSNLRLITLENLDETKMTKKTVIKLFSAKFDAFSWHIWTTNKDYGQYSFLENILQTVKDIGQEKGYKVTAPTRGDWIVIKHKKWKINSVGGQVVNPNW